MVSWSKDTLRLFKDLQIQKMLKHIAPEDIPASEDLYSAAELEEHLSALGEPPLSLIVVGDIMLGDRSEKVLKEQGADYLFMSVGPILRRAGMVLGNLEGPLARNSTRVMRHYSYRVNPDLATALTRAGISILTLANNHALDCGREGVLETLDAVAQAGAAALGAGANEQLAHTPVIRLAGQLDIGLLGYYWNRRCAATADLPGVAIGSREALAADIHALRDKVDRVVVTFHMSGNLRRSKGPRRISPSIAAPMQSSAITRTSSNRSRSTTAAPSSTA